VPATSELPEKTRFLKLSLEELEGALQAVFVTEPDFGHPVVLVA
jgi:hypothetical protein